MRMRKKREASVQQNTGTTIIGRRERKEKKYAL
jgi:hypothetical protein